MSLSGFFAENAVKVENVKYAVSSRFISDKTDEGGECVPLEWELRALTNTEDEELRKTCTKRVPVPGRNGQFSRELDYSLYLGRLAAACTVFPNLHDRELQDSYKVMGADVLLKTMLTPGEYDRYLSKVQELNGFRIPERTD